MRNIVIIFAMLIGLSGFAQTQSSDQFKVKVKGLGCPFCAFGLEKRFKKIEGINDIQIDLEQGLLEFNISAEKRLTFEQIQYQVESAGYTPVNAQVVRTSGKKEVVIFELKEK